MQKCKIKSVKSLGVDKTYNVTMKSEQHNYFVADDKFKNLFITANSHSAAYAYLSYITAYLKANFPEAFICSYLNVEIQRSKHDRVEQLEREARRMNIEILQRSINKCKMDYEIIAEKDSASGISKSQIRPSIMCKGLSVAAAENIVKNQKYKDLSDFAEQTDFKIVDKRSIESLVDRGFFDGDKDKRNIVKKFCVIREDIKKAKKKGVDTVDIFE